MSSTAQEWSGALLMCAAIATAIVVGLNSMIF